MPGDSVVTGSLHNADDYWPWQRLLSIPGNRVFWMAHTTLAGRLAVMYSLLMCLDRYTNVWQDTTFLSPRKMNMIKPHEKGIGGNDEHKQRGDTDET